MCEVELTSSLWSRAKPRKPDPTSRPFLTTIAWTAIVSGALIMGDAVAGGQHTEVTDGPFPFAFALANGAFLALGGAFVAYGLMPRVNASRSWRWEMAGHLLLVGGWGAYATGAWPPMPSALIEWVLLAGLCVGHLARFCMVKEQLRIATEAKSGE